MVNDANCKWHQFDNGSTLGKIVTDDGIVIRDEEYCHNARITISKNGDVSSFAITLGIYGWTFHTSYYGKELDAKHAFDKIKPEIENIVRFLSKTEDEYNKNKDVVGKAFHDFINQVENIASKH